MARILTIDDSMFQRFSLAKLFKELGHEILEAGDGAAGTAMVASERPDLVVLDLNMPGQTGFEALAAIRAIDPDLPVIILSADIQTTTRARCKEAGATAFVNKPFDPEDFAGLVARCLAKGTTR